MDATDQRFAYRCLPLNIANAPGWELLCPPGFSARWDGLNHKEMIRIKPDLGTHAPVVSHFGHGVLTFHVPCLFRTDPGFDLFVTGPINRPKDAIAPLSGIIDELAIYAIECRLMPAHTSSIGEAVNQSARRNVLRAAKSAERSARSHAGRLPCNLAGQQPK